MRLLAALLLLLSSSCSALRTGWVRVDFISGKPTDMMLCSYGIDREGDTVGRCADWDDVSEGLGAMGHDRLLRDVRGTP